MIALRKIENAAKVDVERRPGKGVRLESKYHFKGIEAGPEESINLILAVAFSPRIGFSLVQVAKTLDKLRESLPHRVKDKNQVVLLHCLSGGRSGIAKGQARGLGYANTFNLGSYARAEKIVRSARGM